MIMRSGRDSKQLSNIKKYIEKYCKKLILAINSYSSLSLLLSDKIRYRCINGTITSQNLEL